MPEHIPRGNQPTSSADETSSRPRSKSALKQGADRRMTPVPAKSLSSPPKPDSHNQQSSRPSGPQVGSGGFSTPKTRHFGSKERAFWSSEHPDDRHSKYHHHHHHHHSRHNGRHQPFSPYSESLRHNLSRDNQSVQDLTVLNSLIDSRTGYNEDKRVSEEFINEASKGKKNKSDIKAYYEHLNGILDGWREVDEILDSQFPREVMRRFGTVEEVEQMKGKRRKLPWTQDGSDNEDSGYEEESEVESDDDRPTKAFKRRDTLTARAASALSGFWFGSTPNSKRGSKVNLNDEESTLVSSPKQSTFVKPRPGYGSTSRTMSGLSPIPDGGERSPNTSHDAQHTTVEAQAGKGKDDLKAVTNQVAGVKNGKDPRRRNKSIIIDMQKSSGSDTDDELDSNEGEVDEGSLDRKSANQRDERRARSKQRNGGRNPRLKGLNGNSKSPGENSSEQGSKNRKRSEPGGLSERERQKLLEHVPGRDKEDERDRGVNFAININLLVNVLLLAGKAFAVLSSNSVSLLASLVDSALDLLSTIIIFGTSKAIAYKSCELLL
jgi:hypothetical protein